MTPDLEQTKLMIILKFGTFNNAFDYYCQTDKWDELTEDEYMIIMDGSYAETMREVDNEEL